MNLRRQVEKLEYGLVVDNNKKLLLIRLWKCYLGCVEVDFLEMHADILGCTVMMYLKIFQYKSVNSKNNMEIQFYQSELQMDGGGGCTA